MKTIQKSIELWGIDKLCVGETYISIESPPHMELIIEYVGFGPRGGKAISIAHYYEQDEKSIRDPEILFEVLADGIWEPIAFRQNNPPIYHPITLANLGKTPLEPDLRKCLKSFSRIWNHNLKSQRYIKTFAKKRKQEDKS